MTPVLRVAGITHRYDPAAFVAVLDDVAFDVAAGEVVALVGPSGAGKTTLFRAITGLVTPDTGRVEVAGRDLTELTGARRRLARRDISLVFQQYNLTRRMSALDNVVAAGLAEMPLWRALCRRPGAEARRLALECLGRVGLSDFAFSRADRLSGGQQQRVAIARALAQRSRVILADEPVASLDPAASASVLSVLRSVAKDHGIAVVCSLHQVELVGGFADRVVGLRQGRILLDATTAGFDDEAQALVYAG